MTPRINLEEIPSLYLKANFEELDASLVELLDKCLLEIR